MLLVGVVAFIRILAGDSHGSAIFTAVGFLLLAFTYLGVALSHWTGAPGAALGWYCLWAVDYLWRHWSADGFEDSAHLAQVKTMLAPEGAIEAALAYYPAPFRLWAGHPEVAEKISGKTTVPTLAIFGEADKPRELSADEHAHFTWNSASRSSRARVISCIASNPNT